MIETVGSMATTTLYTIVNFSALYLQPLICVLGILGNVLSTVVFLSKRMRKFSSNVYLAAISFCNSGFSVVLSLQWLEMVDVDLINSQGFCQAIVYLSHVFSSLCAWFVVCIAMENYIIAFHMSKAAVCCKVSCAKNVTIVLTSVSLVLYNGMIWTTDVVYDNETNKTVCTVSEEHSNLNRLYFFLDTGFVICLPMLVIFYLTGAVLRKNVRGGTSSSTNVQGKSIKMLSTVTKAILGISLTYLVLHAPSSINKVRLVVLAEIYGVQYSMPDMLLQNIFQFVSYVSVCANVLCYIAFSNNFRSTVRYMLFCKKSRTERPAFV